MRRLEVKLREKRFSLTKGEVEEILSRLNGKKEGHARYFIEVKGKVIPIKSALMEVLKNKGINLTKLDFTTQDAVRIFRRLGFNVVVKGKKNLKKFIGAIKGGEGFDAVRDKESLYKW